MSTPKFELIHWPATTFATRAEAQAALFRYIDGWYNPRIHKASTGARPTSTRPLGTPGGINTDRLPSNPKAPDPDSRVPGKPGEVQPNMI